MVRAPKKKKDTCKQWYDNHVSKNIILPWYMSTNHCTIATIDTKKWYYHVTCPDNNGIMNTCPKKP